MISTFLIKTALLSWGITIRDVKFDIDSECVIVNYTAKGTELSKSVSFQEIEQLFKTGSELHTAPGRSETGPAGPDIPIP